MTDTTKDAPATPPDRIDVELEHEGTIHVLPLNREGASKAVRSILWALGDLPQPPDDERPPGFDVQHGSASFGIAQHSNCAALCVVLNGVGALLRLTTPQLLQLRTELDATLKAIAPTSERLH